MIDCFPGKAVCYEDHSFIKHFLSLPIYLIVSLNEDHPFFIGSIT